MDPAIIIKKYGNRRLYDTAASRYVNLEEIADLIRKGADVQVVDAKTGEDLTRATLTQIIADDAKDKPAGLPLELLRQLIVASDRARQEFMMWYLNSAFDAYRKVQDAMQSRLSDVQTAVLSPVDAMRRFLSGASEHQSPDSDAEFAALRNRISELENRLGQEAVHRKRAPRKNSGNVRKKKAAK
jgi:polyhydroxyalkanoate synthesis repressor PhaR